MSARGDVRDAGARSRRSAIALPRRVSRLLIDDREEAAA